MTSSFRLLASVAVIALSTLAAPVAGPLGAAERPADSRMTGTFCGELLSSGHLVKVETTLGLRADGTLAGTYRFDDLGSPVDGTLAPDAAERTDGRTVTFRWEDRFGSGRLVITYDEDFGRFDGRWGMGDAQPDQSWWGQRCR